MEDPKNWCELKNTLDIKLVRENLTLNDAYHENCNLHINIPNHALVTLEKYAKLLERSLTDLLNDVLDYISINESKRLENRLRRCVSEVKLTLKKLSGSSGKKRIEYRNACHTVTIYKEEVHNVRELSTDFQKLNKDKEHLESENVQLNENVKVLTSAVLDTTNRLVSAEASNEKLSKSVEKVHSVLPNSGKKVGDMKSSQKRRAKLDVFKEHSESALWFADSFGLQIKTIICEDSKGKSYKLNLTEEDVEDKTRKIECLAYILDQFAVSDVTYHEIAMTNSELPRSYIVVRHRQNLNKTFKIYRTTSKPGAYVKIEDEIISVLQERQIQDSVTFKIGADGARMSRIKQYVTFSLSLIEEDKVDLSSHSMTTLAVCEVSESYEDMSIVLGPLFHDINNLISVGSVQVGEKSVKVQLMIGGDMKMLLASMGLNAANAIYSCVWCKIPKHERHDVSHPMDYYERSPLKRTRTETGYGVKAKPLFDVGFDQVVIDELHVMLRITDVLLTNLIEDSRSLQMEKGLKKFNPHSQQAPLNNLVSKIQECGTNFHIWEVESGRKGKLEWTSLTGSPRKLVIEKLPPKLDILCIHENTLESTRQLWTDFHDLYAYIRGADADAATAFQKAKSWIELFLEIGHERIGYQRANVTPYIHALIYHVPMQIQRFGNITKFSGQNVEKLNDDVRRHHLRKSCRWDGTDEALRTCKRLEYGRKENLKRPKRKYVKKDNEYWNKNLQEARAKRRKSLKESSNQI